MRRASSLILGLTELALAGPARRAIAGASGERFLAPGHGEAGAQAQAHFSVPMVPLGDPRLTDPFDVACDGRILDTVTFVVRGARLTPADDRDLSP